MSQRSITDFFTINKENEKNVMYLAPFEFGLEEDYTPKRTERQRTLRKDFLEKFARPVRTIANPVRTSKINIISTQPNRAMNMKDVVFEFPNGGSGEEAIRNLPSIVDTLQSMLTRNRADRFARLIINDGQPNSRSTRYERSTFWGTKAGRDKIGDTILKYNEALNFDVLEFSISYIDVFRGRGYSIKNSFLSHRKGYLDTEFSRNGYCGQIACILMNESIDNRKKLITSKRASTLKKKIDKHYHKLPDMGFSDFDKWGEIHNINIVILSGFQGIPFYKIYSTPKVKGDKHYIYYDELNKHYVFVNNITLFTQDNDNYFWCNDCDKRFLKKYKNIHVCSIDEVQNCRQCNQSGCIPIKNSTSQVCTECNVSCNTQTCLDLHKKDVCSCRTKNHKWLCRGKGCFSWIDKSRLKTHRCGEKKCSNCDEYFLDKENHRCALKNVDIKEQPKYKHYVVWDIESMAEYDYKNKSSSTHVCNLIVVDYLFGTKEKKVWTGTDCMNEFSQWVLEQKNTCFLAHNGKAYDAWLLHKHIVKYSQKRPNGLVLAGNKIMSMKFKSNCFLDTLNHFGCGLSQLTKMWDMPKGMAKGYFPYRFNTKDNQDYKGTLPDMIYYDFNKMKVDARNDFINWYKDEKKRVGNNYDFQKELKEYCEQDVAVLKLACETYINTFTNIIAECINNATCPEEHKEKINVFNPFECCTIASLSMKVHKAFFYNPEKQPVYIHTGEEYTFIKRAFFGGRTEPCCLYKKLTKKEKKQGKEIRYVDITSLYPTVQFLDMLPFNKPEWRDVPKINGGTPSGVLDSGFYEVDITPPNDLLHPVLPERKDNKLCFDLIEKVEKVYTHLELNKAIEKGYKITKIHKYLYMDMTNELFKGYIGTFFKLKCYSDDKPEDMDMFIDFHKSIGIELDPNKFVPNKPLKSMFKLLLNSLWGKFGMKKDQKANKYVSCPNEFQKMITRAWNKEIELNSINKVNTQCEIDNEVFIQFTELKDNKTSLPTTNVAIAAMTTSNARLRLYKEMDALGERVIYSDTDSIIFLYDPTKYNTPIKGGLGNWTAETKSPIVEVICPLSKTYAYLTEEDKKKRKSQTDLKFKGVSQNYTNDKTINFNALKNTVLNQTGQKLVAQKTDFVKNNKEGTIYVKESVKENDLTYNKRQVLPYDSQANVIRTLPFGHIMRYKQELKIN